MMKALGMVFPTDDLGLFEGYRVRCRPHCWTNPPNDRCKTEAPGSGDLGFVVYEDEDAVDLNLIDEGGEPYGCIQDLPRRTFDESWERVSQ